MRVREIRLVSSLFWVDVRLSQLDGKWLAQRTPRMGPVSGWAGCPNSRSSTRSHRSTASWTS